MKAGGLLRRTVLRGRRTAAFAFFYARFFLRSNVEVVVEVITPGSGLAPAVVELRLRARTVLEVATMAHLITLSPGALVLEARADPPVLYVHGMHLADPEAFLAELGELEERLLRVMRPVGEEVP
ncbi:Na+/H+ antiporter subunit E [Actinocorallia populi]|uniref:Na+/H+ antiporter subunit E n=1 Tax=Actinocorallia populi TaxID=2079200 RepID=UPI0013001D80|nr:Na+/H+ antiporter subunit E [Actinocorallia populi]